MEQKFNRTNWFTEDRFGMFIHWGIYSIPARGEWVMSNEKISVEEYKKYFEQFNPTNYNPREWARAAKKAGMKYAVMTAKHHDGFCLFDSKLTDYKATNTKAGRDLIKEYVEAFREEGLKVGLYYSLLDWHHPDFPAYGHWPHPMSANEEYRDKQHNWENYINYFHGQVKELLTNYGKIDIMWFDFSFDIFTGEKWGATSLVKMMRSIQPDIIIDNRLGGNLKAKNPEIYSGDFDSPEQIMPPKGIVNEEGSPVPWELCITLNNSWGYNSTDKSFKSPKLLIRTLVECVSKNGNLLLNVGPNALGEIPKESLEVLNEIGKWMSKNSDSIYCCSEAPMERPDWGRYTQKGKLIYAHIMERGIGPINLKGLEGKLKRATLLADRSEMSLARPWNTYNYPDDAFINFPTFNLPDDNDTVIELELL